MESWFFNVKNVDFYYQNREMIMKELRKKQQLFLDVEQGIRETSSSIFLGTEMMVNNDV